MNKSRLSFKIIIIIILTLIVAETLSAQKFDVRSTSIVNANDPALNYVVINVPNKKVKEIKDVLISTLSKMYTHPDKVINIVGDNIVVVNGSAIDLLKVNGMYDGLSGKTPYTITYSFDYSYRIEIKDNKIRVNVPSISNVRGKLKMHSKTKIIGPGGQDDFFAAVKESHGAEKVNKMMNDFLHCIDIGCNIKDDW